MSSSSLKLAPLNTISNLSSEVATRLREAIKSGDLPPGTHLVEQDIAQQLGVSRMPVREAIQQIVNEGLAIKEPHRGAYVHPYTVKELDEVYSLRVLLECFIVERAMLRWSPQATERLDHIVTAMADAAHAGNKHQVYKLDAEFHETLWAMANHSVLMEVVSSLRSRISRFLLEATNALTSEALDEHVETHRNLVAVLSSGNIPAAQTAISDHIMAAKERIKTFYTYLDGDA